MKVLTLADPSEKLLGKGSWYNYSSCGVMASQTSFQDRSKISSWSSYVRGAHTAHSLSIGTQTCLDITGEGKIFAVHLPYLGSMGGANGFLRVTIDGTIHIVDLDYSIRPLVGFNYGQGLQPRNELWIKDADTAQAGWKFNNSLKVEIVFEAVQTVTTNGDYMSFVQYVQYGVLLAGPYGRELIKV